MQQLRRVATAMSSLVFVGGMSSSPWAQTPDKTPGSPDGTALFNQQCSACHSTKAGDPPGPGPNLAGVYGRKPGVAPDFKYSEGYAKANFVWDDQHLDAYLTDPQAVIPGSIMPYKQGEPQVRQAIVAYLKDAH
jgi:cytochrome c